MIEVKGLTKRFGGRLAVNNISFHVGKGEVLGFLGPNGAGKTTTMRILTCYMPATSGTATVAGFDVFEQSMEVRRRIGYLPENPPLYDEMTVTSYLDFAGRIKGIPGRHIGRRIDIVAQRCGLEDVLHRVLGHLSRGYRQRVGLAQALINDPPILILDEPTVGLDPAQIVEIRKMIKGLGDDHTIIFSTHILPEVAATCTNLVIINEGKAMVAGSLDQISSRGGRSRLLVQVMRDSASIAGQLREIPGVFAVTADGGRPGRYALDAEVSDELRERVAGMIVSKGWGLLEMTPVVPSLEEIYLSVTARASEPVVA
ncbi:MAG: ATP-binding cassette domain-containing protein [Acidobacteriota bacterium]